MPPKPHLRIAYDDLEELRADVCAMLDVGAYTIDWEHIDARSHEVEEPQVIHALRWGAYSPSRYPGRYLAEYGHVDLAEIRVVFEVHDEAPGRRLLVITAYPLEDL